MTQTRSHRLSVTYSYFFFTYFYITAERTIDMKIKNLFGHRVGAEHQYIAVIFLDIRRNFNLVFSLLYSRFSSALCSGENASLLGCQPLYSS